MFCVTAGNIHLEAISLWDSESLSMGETKQKWTTRGIWVFLDHRSRVEEEQPHKGMCPQQPLRSWVGLFDPLLLNQTHGLFLSYQHSPAFMPFSWVANIFNV